MHRLLLLVLRLLLHSTLGAALGSRGQCSACQSLNPQPTSASLLPSPSMDGKRLLDLSKDEDFHPEPEPLEGDLDPGLPSTEDVILKTEQVTKNIQELLRAAQEFKHDRSGWIPPSAPPRFRISQSKGRAEEKGVPLVCRIGHKGGGGVWKGKQRSLPPSVASC